jgi:hypothetical protein
MFVVDAPTFHKMTAQQIQCIFRERHILVHGVETEKMEFNLEGLATLGSLTLPLEVQGECLSDFPCVYPVTMGVQWQLCERRRLLTKA